VFHLRTPSPPRPTLLPYTTLFPISGAGSVLYPPHLLDKKLLFNLDYIKHYITVDDLWLKLVEVLSNVPTVVCSLRIEKMRRNSRSEEHTSELQSRFDIVCRLLLETK